MSDRTKASDQVPLLAIGVISLLLSCVIFAIIFTLCWWLDDSSTQGMRDLILNGVYPWPRLTSRWTGAAMLILMAAQFAVYGIVAFALRRSGVKPVFVGSVIAGFHFFGVLLWLG
jgi:Mn2+/Fe2+ NRAMP family transporter